MATAIKLVSEPVNRGSISTRSCHRSRHDKAIDAGDLPCCSSCTNSTSAISCRICGDRHASHSGIDLVDYSNARIGMNQLMRSSTGAGEIDRAPKPKKSGAMNAIAPDIISMVYTTISNSADICFIPPMSKSIDFSIGIGSGPGSGPTSGNCG